MMTTHKYNAHPLATIGMGVLTGAMLATGAMTQDNQRIAHAEGKLSKYTTSLSGRGPIGYQDLPKDVQALIKNNHNDNPQSVLKSTNAYPYGQCTWYAYERAQERGRKYSTSEGNGGEWGLDVAPSNGAKTGTVGNGKPKPQVAVSIHEPYSNGTGIKTKATQFGGFTPGYGHVVFCEYIDSDGNGLFSEAHVKDIPPGAPVDYVNGKIDYFVAPASAVNSGELDFVDPLNKNQLKDWGKNPDGTIPKNAVAGADDTSGEDGDAAGGTGGGTVGGPTDDSFTVNGYGSLTRKEYDEQTEAVEAELPTRGDLYGLPKDQRDALMNWVQDYSSSRSASVVRMTRVGLTLIGYLLLMFSIALLLSYAFDRLGIFEFSAVALLTLGNYTTVYSHDQAKEMKARQSESKPMELQNMIIVMLLAIGIFLLIITGRIYDLAYGLYSIVYGISEWVANHLI